MIFRLSNRLKKILIRCFFFIKFKNLLWKRWASLQYKLTHRFCTCELDELRNKILSHKGTLSVHVFFFQTFIVCIFLRGKVVGFLAFVNILAMFLLLEKLCLLGLDPF